MADSTEQIVYDESVRAIALQERAVDNLRARTATLLTAASLVTAFLGAQVLSRRESLDVGAWLAIAAFAGVCLGALTILWPWSWVFSLSPRVLIADHVDVSDRNDPRRLYRFIAMTNEVHWERNDAVLERLGWCFRLATVALAAEVVTWLVVLGTT